ncbi:MAG: MATE family efflux transporter [Bacteroides sp.]|nr:MATE family efflux transporter [Bacteroides sp.]
MEYHDTDKAPREGARAAGPASGADRGEMAPKRLGRAVLALALPAILSNITVPLLGLSDTFISGHLGSEVFIAAIAVGTMMVNTVYWLFGFLRMGTTGLVAEAVGASDTMRQRRLFTVSLLLGFFIGVVLFLVGYPLGRLMVLVMEPSSDAAGLGMDYFRVSVMSAPAVLATMAAVGWMIGRQNTVGPMIVAIAVNVINIVLSFSFVFGLESGFIGVAWGTCIANWCGLLLALVIAWRVAAPDPLFAPLRGLMRGVDPGRFFRVNSDLMVRSACIMAIIFAMTSLGGRMGDLTLAVNAIVMQMFMFFSYFMDGFAFSGEALCGRFAGAGSRRGILSTLRVLMMWTLGVTAVFTVAYAFGARDIAALLTDEPRVVDGVGALHVIVALIPAISAAAFIFDGVYIGMTATRTLLWVTFTAMAAYFLVWSVPELTPFLTSNQRLWAAFLTSLLLRGGLLALRLPAHLPGAPR